MCVSSYICHDLLLPYPVERTFGDTWRINVTPMSSSTISAASATCQTCEVAAGTLNARVTCPHLKKQAIFLVKLLATYVVHGFALAQLVKVKGVVGHLIWRHLRKRAFKGVADNGFASVAIYQVDPVLMRPKVSPQLCVVEPQGVLLDMEQAGKRIWT